MSVGKSQAIQKVDVRELSTKKGMQNDLRRKQEGWQEKK